ncbi:surface lipoprotein assembly modifier [Neisseria sp.]|uniref:surface lipoprotein assembly modifier n=1 Tax=Neisseria sp. TaxID=192066 RepID=UPI0035A0AE01
MRHFPLILSFVSVSVSAAPISTPTAPQPDLTRSQIQQTETKNQQPSLPSSPVSMTSEELIQQPEMLRGALDIALAQEHLANIRFLLSLYHQLPEHQQDKVLLQYAEAVLMRADGKYAEAEKRLRALLTQHPEYAPIRLQLALTLSQDGQSREAASEIKHIRQTPDLPSDVVNYLDQFDQYLNQEKKWQFNANAYYIQDNNVSREPEQRTYGPWEFPEPRSAHGIGYELSAQKQTPIKGHWAARVQASTYGKFYWDAHDYDDLTLRTDAAAVWRNAKQEMSVGPFYDKRWYGTEPYSETVGGTLRYSRTLSPKWQLYNAWQSGYRKHDDRTYLDGASHSTSLSLLHNTSPHHSFIYGIDGGIENARDKSEAYKRYGLRAAWMHNWGKSRAFSTTLNTSIQRRQYDERDIFSIQRKDTEYSTRLSMAHQKLSWKGFTPRLNWTWSHIHSNHFYYRYDQHRVFLDVSKHF